VLVPVVRVILLIRVYADVAVIAGVADPTPVALPIVVKTDPNAEAFAEVETNAVAVVPVAPPKLGENITTLFPNNAG
jgi:hypothetical protein